jgi:uncharacterized delta-60 repeat protein
MAGSDLTFDGDGQVITDLGGRDSIRQLLSVVNGKVLAIGVTADSSGKSNTFIIRYNADGSLDTSFGTGGKSSTGLAFRRSLIADDGKIIIVGIAANGNNSVIRYLANGQLDTSFATNGEYNSPSISGDIVLDSYIRKNPNNNSNEIIINGLIQGYDYTKNPPISKSSSVITLLDVNGQVKPFPINNTTAAPIVIDNNVLNQIISSATVNSSDPAVQKIVNMIGQAAIDRLRSQYAVASYSIFNVATKPENDGSILLALNGSSGTSSNQYYRDISYLTHFGSDGKFDTNFGSNGLGTFPFLTNDIVPVGAGFDKNDRIYPVVYNKITDDISVFRIAKNGVLDSTFGTNGKLNLPAKTGSISGLYTFNTSSVIFDSQNRILVATTNNNGSFISISRINDNGTIDTTFGTNGELQLAAKGYIDSDRIILGADDRLFLGDGVNGDLLITKYDIGGTNDLTGGTVLPGALTFDRSDYSINEDGTKILNVTVNRTGGSDGNISATINLTNGTAKAGEDYNSSPITVSFADKETSKTIAIPLVNDTVYEPSETVNLTLANPTNGATLGSQTTAVLTILDDDAVPGVLSLRSAVYSFKENDAPATTVVTIDRTGGSDGEVSASLLFTFPND